MKEIKLDVVEKALLPTRFYYDKFGDHIRLWINESSTTSPEIREHFDFELKEALRSVGIDIRDRALTIESARSQLYQNEFLERLQNNFDERLNALVKDDKLRDRYFADINTHVENLDKNTSEFYKLVNTQIQ